MATPTDAEQRNFNAIASLRLAIIFNGLKMKPTPASILGVVDIIGRVNMNDDVLSDPKQANWRLYDYDPDLACPIHAVACPGWLVKGAHALAAANNLPFEMGDFDPTDWTNGLRETFMELPTEFTSQDESGELLEWFASAAEEQATGETMEAIRKAIRAKKEAIAEGLRCINGVNDDGEEDRGATLVVVIRPRA